jgi:type I restriction enzyme M protein
VLENDWLEAIIALPLNIFYNTGIATYVWVLANKKAAHRKGKVQLIDAKDWFLPLSRNLGKKNCVLSDVDIERIVGLYLAEPHDTPESRWFDTADFGYWKVTVERPLRWRSQLTPARIETLRFASGDEALRTEIWDNYGEKLYAEFPKLKAEIEVWLRGDNEEEEEAEEGEEESAPAKKSVPEKRRKRLLDAGTWQRDRNLVELARLAQTELGEQVFDDHNVFRERFDAAMKAHGEKPSASDRKIIFRAVSWRDDNAPPVVAKRTRLKSSEAFEPKYDGRYLIADGKNREIVEYEPDTDLRDTEQVPLKEPGGIDAFFQREVLPFAPDAWIDHDKTQIGYEISFARYFYRPAPLRTLEEIRAEIVKLQQQTEGLMNKIVGKG